MDALPSSSARPLDAWTGAFGDAYTERNVVSAAAVHGRARAFGEVIARTEGDVPSSVLEVGSNLGLNLRALSGLVDGPLWGIEPNASARKRVIDDGVLPEARMLAGAGHAIPLADGAVDLAFTCGVLIHVDPAALEATMREIHRVSAKYVLCMEYFSPRPETITYRGEEGLLFKRDFGGLYLDLFSDLKLVDYGFFWKRTTVMDDTTWWLFRKAGV